MTLLKTGIGAHLARIWQSAKRFVFGKVEENKKGGNGEQWKIISGAKDMGKEGTDMHHMSIYS